MPDYQDQQDQSMLDQEDEQDSADYTIPPPLDIEKAKAAIRAQTRRQQDMDDLREQAQHEVEEEDAWDDMFDVDEDDVTGGDIDSLVDGDGEEDEDDDFSDLTDITPDDDLDMFGVTEEDVMGTAPKKKARKKLPLKPVVRPITGLGGIGA